ncbi:MAG: glutathione peroxidase [Tepidimonas sp.]|uniref:glutathione peroxidase n=1 Tax=Tepidimonas sp. TaxID=2002775 RepID=UPI0040549FEC
MPRLTAFAVAALATALLTPMSTPSHATTAESAPAASCPAILQHRFNRLQDEKPQDLCQYAGKVVLVVNTASYCGFTQQYQGLEALYRRYRDRGLVVLGFPSNDFGQQEPGSNQQIAEFCENTFGVQFPMFAKSSVRGPQANPLFKQLVERTGTTPRWNFYKYLISRDGRTVLAYSSMTAPDSESLRRDIERLLGS